MKRTMLILTMLNVIFFIAFTYAYSDLNNRLNKVEYENKKLHIELSETQARCERMTNSCLDILANGAWE